MTGNSRATRDSGDNQTGHQNSVQATNITGEPGTVHLHVRSPKSALNFFDAYIDIVSIHNNYRVDVLKHSPPNHERASMETKAIRDTEFEKEVLRADQPWLVDFCADLVRSCRMIEPVIEELALEYRGN